MIHPQIYVGLQSDYEQLSKKDRSKKESLAIIIEAVCHACELNKTSVMSKIRDRELVYARHIIRAMATKEIDTTLSWLGGQLDCHHASIIHSKKVVEDLLFSDKDFRELYNSCVLRHKILQAVS